MVNQNYKINQKEIDSLINSSPETRFEYAVKRIADWEKVWTIVDDAGNIGMLTDEAKNVIFPLWPFEEFAKLCCKDEFQRFKPLAIELSEFLENYLPDYEKKGYKFSVLPLPTGKGEIMEISMFKVALDSELDRIE
ncbi:Protein of unknown function [Chitinophaga sp. CF118]|uniref:DUF2750 domain-containing protein n=1 Tax=Chitinophaga sp. CF118 TaxID=1884367 RepID=UPI0008ED92C2|nr:DUF2750 domain-containing protein [Chitinophaga sp. CF118]SFD83740.1 Protein of unknown function [Chitinophaga sp. CF118]